jgi:hypothetical protein
MFTNVLERRRLPPTHIGSLTKKVKLSQGSRRVEPPQARSLDELLFLFAELRKESTLGHLESQASDEITPEMKMQ